MAADPGSVQRVALAYSGGLDTSVIIPWLRESYGCEVVAVVADVGQPDDLEAVYRKALASGAAACDVVDVKEEFARDFAFPALRAGALYEERYLLGTSLARPLIGRVLVERARAHGCDAVAHGATGKGNDQVRFEAAVAALAPDLPVIAPWRCWHIRSREDALDYAAAHGIPVEATRKSIYSRDANLWHISHEGGDLEDAWHAPGPEVLIYCVPPEQAPDRPEELVIAFETGVPVAVDGRGLQPVELVKELNRRAGAHGVGIVEMVENRLVGMKSRGVYETPGGTVLYEALRALERLTYDRDAMDLRAELGRRYARLVYDGLWFTPAREAIDAAVGSLAGVLNGEVRVRLFKGSVMAVAARSPDALYDPDLATFGEGVAYDHADAAGFIRLFTLSLATRARLAARRGAAPASAAAGDTGGTATGGSTASGAAATVDVPATADAAARERPSA
ncbi:MAG TPA: argininosuccinate synthase [Bacillota bacterium]